MRDDNLAIPGLLRPTEIGRGGFGVVYRAKEEDLGRDVAVKVLTGHLDQQTRTRFERERRAMGVLSSHPNIITIFSSGTAASGEPYLVMEYLPGGSLADRLASGGALSWQDCLRIGVELAGALETAHRAGVLHRDVKPGNIMVDGLGRAKLGDFGIAHLDGGPETRSSVITASVAHAPPEVIAGEKPEERSDVYSLASTIYELASGAPAFVRPDDESMIPLFARIVHEAAPDLRLRGVPDAIAAVLEKALSKARDDRHQSAAELGEALIGVQERMGLPTTNLWIAIDQGTDTVPPVEPARGVSLHPAAAEQRPPPMVWPAPIPWPAVPSHAARPPPAPPPPEPVASVAPVGPYGGGTGFVPPPGRGGPPTPHRSAGPAPPPPSPRRGVPVALYAIAAMLVVGGLLALVFRHGSGDQDRFQTVTSGDGDDGSADGGNSGAARDAASPTVETAATNPPRPAFLSDLPPLPATESPYEDYRTVTDSSGSFLLDVPDAWDEELAIEGQVVVSPDNNAALGDASISGGVVSGTQGIGFWDPDIYLDALLDELAEPDDPCIEVVRKPYDDGFLDGLLYAEWCNGGEVLSVAVIASNPDRASVMLVAVQMVDERDVAAFETMLDSLFLIDADLLPEPTL